MTNKNLSALLQKLNTQADSNESSIENLSSEMAIHILGGENSNGSCGKSENGGGCNNGTCPGSTNSGGCSNGSCGPAAVLDASLLTLDHVFSAVLQADTLTRK